MKKIKSLLKPTVLALAIALIGSFALVKEGKAAIVTEYVALTADSGTVHGIDDYGDEFTATVYWTFNDEDGDEEIVAGRDTLEAGNPKGIYHIRIYPAP